MLMVRFFPSRTIFQYLHDNRYSFTTSDCVKPRECLQQAELADSQALQYTDIAQKNNLYFLSPTAIILGLSPREGQS